ncbi:hypothetical [Yersinia pestis KIM10+]|uniref:Uncharacterized protein n=1 Tax=Yersinia pestis TaxID=632 RepID=Q8CL00_YERPE|nr:hypothetical [Yersinia pestis KIM10+]
MEQCMSIVLFKAKRWIQLLYDERQSQITLGHQGCEMRLNQGKQCLSDRLSVLDTASVAYF